MIEGYGLTVLSTACFEALGLGLQFLRLGFGVRSRLMNLTIRVWSFHVKVENFRVGEGRGLEYLASVQAFAA